MIEDRMEVGELSSEETRDSAPESDIDGDRLNGDEGDEFESEPDRVL